MWALFALCREKKGTQIMIAEILFFIIEFTGYVITGLWAWILMMIILKLCELIGGYYGKRSDLDS